MHRRGRGRPGGPVERPREQQRSHRLGAPGAERGDQTGAARRRHDEHGRLPGPQPLRPLIARAAAHAGAHASPKRYIVPAGSASLAVELRRRPAPTTSANTAGLAPISSISVETGVGSPGWTSLA